MAWDQALINMGCKCEHELTPSRNLEHVCLDSAKLKHPRGLGTRQTRAAATRPRSDKVARTEAEVQQLLMHPSSGLQLQEVVRDGG